MVLSKFSDSKSITIVKAEGALRDTLLLILLLFFANPLAVALQRDTLQIGPRTYFVPNLGQWDDPSRFRARMDCATLFVENNGYTLDLIGSSHTHEGHSHHHASSQGHAYRVRFLNCAQQPTIEGREVDPDEGYDNYFLGSDPSRWVSRLQHYYTLYYSGLYPGIDMDIRVAQNALKSNFYIAPHANPSAIIMQYEGADKIYVSDSNLIIRTSVNDLVELAPYAYQDADTGRVAVPCRYRVRGSQVSFVLGSYDTSKPLVIDPVLIFSTYTGSESDNWGTTATYDLQKNAYTAGLVFGSEYPVSTGAYDPSFNGNADIGIFKFDPTGHQRLYATYLGGQNADMPHSMFVNSFGELVIFGTTGSNNFPTTEGAYDRSFNGGTNIQYEGSSYVHFPQGSDIFVCRFSGDGTQLQASTYVGGSFNDGLNYRDTYRNPNLYDGTTIMCGNDSLYFNYGDGARGELITDDQNNIYVGSCSFSYDFPATSYAVNPLAPGGQNGVVFKIDYNLRTLIWSTFLGGSADDAVYSIDVDSSYNVLVCGGTNSSNFPTTPGSFQTAYGGGSADGFVAKISYNGNELMSSTYFGSTAYDQIYFVRTGRQDDVFLYGQTKDTTGAFIYQADYNVPGAGMVLAHLSSDLTSRIWSTTFGSVTPTGRPNISPTAFAADICNRVYVSGWGRDYAGECGCTWNESGTYGMPVTADAYQSTTDGQDFYIMAMDADASGISYATFFGEQHSPATSRGNDHVDGGTSRFDRHATLYQSVCASCGRNDSFPLSGNVWGPHNLSNNCNNALFRINIHDDYPVAECETPAVGCAPYQVNFVNTGRGQRYAWNFGDGTTSIDDNPQHTFALPGTYRVRLVAYLDSGCRTTDTFYVPVMVLSEHGTRTVTDATCSREYIQIGPQPIAGCSYEWIQGNVTDPTIPNPYVNQGGTYILRITSNAGCTQTDTFEVLIYDLLDTLILQSPTCPGGSDGRAIAVPFAMVSDSALYYWDGILGDSILTGLSADGRTHTLRIESHGCQIEVPFTITDPPTLEHSVQSSPVICGQGCTGWAKITYNYPGGPSSVIEFDNLCDSTYVLAFADSAGCPYSETVTITRDTSLQNLQVWADQYHFFLSESVGLHVTRVPYATYSWTHPHTLSDPTSPNPTATPEDTVTVYTVTVTNPNGCTWEGSVVLNCTEINCDRPNIFIPNTFSPNGDGLNDRLCFRGEYVLDFYLAIYSRWGEKVFETHDINDCWDGRYNGQWCQPGVYAYYCKVKCEAGFQNLLKGDITLIR